MINRSLFPKFDCEINLEKLKDRIVYTLVNADSNKSRLKTIPYRILEGTDLAITYRLIIDIDFNATASSDVTNALIEHLGVTENDLYTFASLALKNNADIKSVQNILGHVDASTTLNTYACAYEDQKRSVIEDMEAKWIKAS